MATLIARLETSFPKSLEEARTLVATLDGCSQWFQGGTKELKLAVPMFEQLESKLETLVEYVQVSDSMVELSGRLPPSSQGQDFAAYLRNIVGQLRERQQRWGTSLPTVGRDRKARWKEDALRNAYRAFFLAKPGLPSYNAFAHPADNI